MMLKAITILCLVAFCCSQESDVDKVSLDELIAQVFGDPVSESQPDGKKQDSDRRNKREADEICTTNKGNKGLCVPYYLCDDAILQLDEVGLIDIHLPSDTPCLDAIEVCCEAKNKATVPPAESAKREGCGWHNPNGVTIRLNNLNEETQFGEFPWVCAILKNHKEEKASASSEDTMKPTYAGSGSLIHPSVVLTAAHVALITNGSTLRVRAGEWNTRTLKEPYPHQERDVLSAEIHKDYNKYLLYNDVAVLFLAEPMDLAPNVALACLPLPRETAVSDSCVTTGWGKERFGNEKLYAVLLRKAKLPVVDRAACIARLRKTRLGQKFVLHSSFMCAGGEKDHEACMGDGGSPLSCPIENEPSRFSQAGIVAWGIGCGGDGTPSVYVDVANLRSWIDDKVAEKGYDPKVYSY